MKSLVKSLALVSAVAFLTAAAQAEDAMTSKADATTAKPMHHKGAMHAMKAKHDGMMSGNAMKGDAMKGGAMKGDAMKGGAMNGGSMMHGGAMQTQSKDSMQDPGHH